MVDVAVMVDASWVCQDAGRHLTDVLLPVNLADGEEEGDETNGGGPVLLEQGEEGRPCVLTLRCHPDAPDAIAQLLLVSEARTMEVYGQTGEYLGTVRGQEDGSLSTDSSDRGPFYRKQLTLDEPTTSCDVKLVVLSGRCSVCVRGLVVGLRRRRCPAPGGAIDMQQVRSLLDEMGTSLSPGAQNLMDMVHVQQQRQSSSLETLLPLLMRGGVFPASPFEPRKDLTPPTETLSPPLPGSITPSDLAAVTPNGAMSLGSSSFSSSPSPSSSPPSLADEPPCDVSADPGGGVSHAQLSAMMSHLLKGRGQGDARLLPVLQSVCSQVTQLRLDNAAAAAQRKEKKSETDGSWDLDWVMERRLDQMEQRLKEHVDRRLDALEQKLEKVLVLALQRDAIGPPAAGPPEPEAPPPTPN